MVVLYGFLIDLWELRLALNYRLLDRMGKEIIAACVEVQWNIHVCD
jgi:hypothetical protein